MRNKWQPAHEGAGLRERVLPTLPDGTYAPKTLRPLALPALDPDPRLARSLPWNFTGFGFAPRSAGWLRSFGFRTFLGGTVLALFLCVPALLLRWIWRRWSWKQGLAALVVMVGLVGWALVATQPAGMPLRWLVHMLLPALYALPQVWFLSSFAKALAGRRWVQAALLAAADLALYRDKAARRARGLSRTEGSAPYPVIGQGVIYPTLGLSNEAGEVSGKIKKIFRDKEGEVGEADRAALAAELGDVLWYLAQVATELGLSLDEIATRNIAKLLDRKARGKIRGDGDDR